MAWRGSTDAKDRFFSAIVYLIPLYYAYASFGLILGLQYPILSPVLDLIGIILTPISIVFGILNSIIPLGLGGLIIFFALYAGVVRNEKIKHFIRFNTLQSILIGIALSLVSLLISPASSVLGNSFIFQIISTVVFLGVLIACSYGIFQSAVGRYAEMPTISEAAYSQLR